MLTVRARLGVWYVSSKPNLCPISVNILLCVLSNHIVPNIIQLNCINTWYIWATFLNNFINFLWILETHDMPRQFRFLSFTNQLHFNLNLAMCKCQCKFLQNNSGHEMLIMILWVFLWETKECIYLVVQNEWVPWKKRKRSESTIKITETGNCNCQISIWALFIFSFTLQRSQIYYLIRKLKAIRIIKVIITLSSNMKAKRVANNALAPCLTRTSAAMILSMWNVEVLVFCESGTHDSGTLLRKCFLK